VGRIPKDKSIPMRETSRNQLNPSLIISENDEKMEIEATKVKTHY